ncbi:MAG: recombinase family protein, partial [Firmicutes bacterium]|nr:recombinase family protein [Bacillota bacterium]
MKAAIYARYSSELQRQTSIEDQVRLCREAAVSAGYAVEDHYVLCDHEISGATAERPGYQRLLRLAQRREVDAVFVEAQDRLWRDAAEMYQALKRLRYWGVRVFSVSTGADLTDRTGKIVAALVGLKDELFIEDLRDKTRRGMLGQISRGYSAGGRAFGYRSEPVYDDVGRVVGYRRVVDPHEAEVVRYIFRLYAVEGLTPRAIAHRLNEERVRPPRTARGRRTGCWTPSTIAGSPVKGIGILCNPLYIGRMVWNRSTKLLDPDSGRRTMRARPRSEWLSVEVPELRIVPQDLWDRAQARRQQRQRTASGSVGGARPKYLLSGLLVCGECGGRYVVQRHRSGVVHYGCAAHYDRGPVVCGNSRLVRREVVEQRVLDYVFGDLFAPHRLAYLTQAVDAAIERELAHTRDGAALRAQALAEARRELDNIAAAIRAGVVTPTTKAMLEDAERRVAALEQAVSEARRRPAPVVSLRSTVERYLHNLRELLADNTDEARRMLALALDKIVLRRNGGRLVAQITGR